MTTTLILIFMAVSTGKLCLAWRSFNMRFDSTECLPKNEIIEFFNCSIESVRRNQEGFNMNMRFSKDIIKPTLDLSIINERNIDEKFVLVNITNINGCQFLENRDTFNILQIIRKEFAKHSNLPSKCPVKKGTEINVKNLTMDSESFPPYVPATKFHVVVNLRENSDLVSTLVVRGRVEPKKKIFGF